MLLNEYRVERVILCELFTRSNPRNLSPEQYETKRRQANTILRTLLDSHQHIRFWSHRRIFGAQTEIFSNDGIHLSPFGQRHLYRSLRHAVMMAVRQ